MRLTLCLWLILISGLIGFSACTRTDAPSTNDIDRALNSIRYKRDGYGNCLAIVVSQNSYGNVLSIAAVPHCPAGL